MTQEEKRILLLDLSARLSHGVKVSITAHNPDYEKDFGKTIIAELIGIHIAKDDDGTTHTCFVTCYDKFKTQGNDIDTIKPYLRPISSMMQGEWEEMTALIYPHGRVNRNPDNKNELLLWLSAEGNEMPIILMNNVFSWLNAHHFDYRGLIPMGLALEAPKNMYKTE